MEKIQQSENLWRKKHQNLYINTSQIFGQLQNRICEELKESVFRMSQYRESLKEMYKELTEMCHKPDMELLQVRKEG